VIATGAWLPELVPAARGAVTVIPQHVAYVRIGVPARAMPSWVHFGGAASGIAYGLAEIGREAIKVGLHATRGTGIDPDVLAAPSAGDEEALRQRLGQVLAVPVHEVLGSEPCLYTVTSTEEFIVDGWPGDPRVVFASACSGHGFKFAPLTGRVLAELVIRGRADLPGDRDLASLFALRRNEPSITDA